MTTLLASRIVTILRDWSDPTTETNTANTLKILHSGSLRDTDVCGTTLEHAKAFREMWADITSWLVNFQPEEPWHVPWLWSANASAQASAMHIYTEAQRIAVLMDDHERTLLRLHTFLGRFVAFRDIATKDALSKPSERSGDLHYTWSQLSDRISSLRRLLPLISRDIKNSGPLLVGPFLDRA